MNYLIGLNVYSTIVVQVNQAKVSWEWTKPSLNDIPPTSAGMEDCFSQSRTDMILRVPVYETSVV